MMSLVQHPSFLAMLLAVVGIFISQKYLRGLALLMPILSCLLLAKLSMANTGNTLTVLNYELHFINIDSLTLLFAFIFSLVALIGFIYGLSYLSKMELCAALFYYGSTLGAVLAGDLISLFIFWEMLTIGAAILILEARSIAGINSGKRYVLYHIFGGLLFLVGLILHLSQSASLELQKLEITEWSGLLILLGIGVNCAWPLLHGWMIDAYSRSSIAGVIFLSAFTTKLAVYVLIRLFPGTDFLIWLGIPMVCIPIIYALRANNMRKLLSYSIMTQVGIMVIAIGIGTPLALIAASAHAICHLLYKALLFMTIGEVERKTGSTDLDQLGGLFKKMPATAIFCCIGSAAIAGLPFFSGFISKTLLAEAISQANLAGLNYVLFFAAIMAPCYIALKLPYLIFFNKQAANSIVAKNQELLTDVGSYQLLAILIASMASILIGCFPSYFLALFPTIEYQVIYSSAHILKQIGFLMVGSILFASIIRIYGAKFYHTGQLKDVDLFDQLLLSQLFARIGQQIDNITSLFTSYLAQPIEQLFKHNLFLQTCRSLSAPEARPRLEQAARLGIIPLGITLMMALMLLLVLMAQVV